MTQEQREGLNNAMDECFVWGSGNWEKIPDPVRHLYYAVQDALKGEPELPPITTGFDSDLLTPDEIELLTPKRDDAYLTFFSTPSRGNLGLLTKLCEYRRKESAEHHAH